MGIEELKEEIKKQHMEEMAETEKSRTISDAKLLTEGDAEYVIDENGNKLLHVSIKKKESLSKEPQKEQERIERHKRAKEEGRKEEERIRNNEEKSKYWMNVLKEKAGMHDSEERRRRWIRITTESGSVYEGSGALVCNEHGRGNNRIEFSDPEHAGSSYGPTMANITKIEVV